MARISLNPRREVQVEDGFLVALAKQGDRSARDRLVRRYHSFVRLKASSYFLAGGDSDDLLQEGLVGLYKAIRDYRTDRESSFRNFAELCITRQIITAVKTATRNKHQPLNQYVSFSSTPAGEATNRRRSTSCCRARASWSRSTRSSRAKSCARSSRASRVRSRSSRAACSRSTRRPLIRGNKRGLGLRRRPWTTRCSGSSARSRRTWSRAPSPFEAARDRVLVPAFAPLVAVGALAAGARGARKRANALARPLHSRPPDTGRGTPPTPDGLAGSDPLPSPQREHLPQP